MRTEAVHRFTVLVEIKTPQTPLLGREYRNGAYLLGTDLNGGINQLLANAGTWELEGARRLEYAVESENENIHTVRPRGILVIGNTSQLDQLNQRNTFERLRRSLHGLEIITFDELFARAEHIVDADQVGR